jgi:hypothetical protein
MAEAFEVFGQGAGVQAGGGADGVHLAGAVLRHGQGGQGGDVGARAVRLAVETQAEEHETERAGVGREAQGCGAGGRGVVQADGDGGRGDVGRERVADDAVALEAVGADPTAIDGDLQVAMALVGRVERVEGKFEEELAVAGGNVGGQRCAFTDGPAEAGLGGGPAGEKMRVGRAALAEDELCHGARLKATRVSEVEWLRIWW